VQQLAGDVARLTEVAPYEHFFQSSLFNLPIFPELLQATGYAGSAQTMEFGN